MIQRRFPGTRRRRLRRYDEIEALRAIDPERAAELEALRAVSPQAYRKELRRLYRQGVIAKGRGFAVPEDALGLLEGPLEAVREGLERGIEAGEYGFRVVAGLHDAEVAGRRRADVLAWLEEKVDALLEAEGRVLRA